MVTYFIFRILFTEQSSDWHLEQVRELNEPTRTYPIDSRFVFLHLLKADAELTAISSCDNSTLKRRDRRRAPIAISTKLVALAINLSHALKRPACPAPVTPACSNLMTGLLPVSDRRRIQGVRGSRQAAASRSAESDTPITLLPVQFREHSRHR